MFDNINKSKPLFDSHSCEEDVVKESWLQNSQLKIRHCLFAGEFVPLICVASFTRSMLKKQPFFPNSLWSFNEKNRPQRIESYWVETATTNCGTSILKGVSTFLMVSDERQSGECMTCRLNRQCTVAISLIYTTHHHHLNKNDKKNLPSLFYLKLKTQLHFAKTKNKIWLSQLECEWQKCKCLT